MLEAQRNLEVEHPFAMALKPKVPRLDDAGMHRADRHLVHFLAFDPEEIGHAGSIGVVGGAVPGVQALAARQR